MNLSSVSIGSIGMQAVILYYVLHTQSFSLGF